jgi:hypothetical protein
MEIINEEIDTISKPSILDDSEIDALKDAGYTDEDIKEYIDDVYSEMNKPKIISCRCVNGCNYSYDFAKLLNIDEFSYTPEKKYTSIHHTTNRIVFDTPRLYLPFGLDKYYNNWSLNFEFDNKHCNGHPEFLDFLRNIECAIINNMNIKQEELNTQLKIKNGVPGFYARIQSINRNSSCKIIDTRKNVTTFVNVYKFPKDVHVIATLRLGNIWKINNLLCYKYNIMELRIVD